MAKKLQSISAQIVFDELNHRHLSATIISSRFNLFTYSYRGHHYFIKGTSFPVNPQPSCLIANNKFLTKKILTHHNIPMPQSWLVHTPTEARTIVTKHHLFPCVLKPARGAHGRHVYANIESLQEFDSVLAHIFAKPGDKDILLEEHITGHDYRVLVVGDQAVAVLMRTPAHVIGDGHHTIKQLIAEFNSNPLVGKKYEKPLCKIKPNGETKRVLTKQHKNLASIPAPDEYIALRHNANISTGGIGQDVTDQVPTSVKRLAVLAAQALSMGITGVDIIYSPDRHQPYIIELNDCPGIDIHQFPTTGSRQNVAVHIVDYLLKHSLTSSFHISALSNHHRTHPLTELPLPLHTPPVLPLQ